MKSNYKPIGEYIQLVDERNKGLQFTNLLGISVTKQFIPSVANIIGTDMENYKIIRKNQFACSIMQVRRDKKMPVALYVSDEPSIISQAYPIFEIKDTSQLLPEYLMMWFTRSEFDRQACFNAVGGVRGSLEWEDFCLMQLPIPSPKKQREIVKEYKVIQNRIALNNELIAKLEETAQTIYKRWFVDFEFPNENGLPYKSNGGEMVWCEELEKDVPLGWEMKSLSNIATYLNGLAMQKFEPTSITEAIPVIKIRELNKGKTDNTSSLASKDIPTKYIIKNGDIIFSWSGTLAVEIWCGGIGGLNQHLFKVFSKDYESWLCYFGTKYFLDEFIRIADGNKTSLGHIKREHLDDALLCIPSDFLLINTFVKPCFNKIRDKKIENNKLEEFKELLLSSMTKVESEIEIVGN